MSAIDYLLTLLSRHARSDVIATLLMSRAAQRCDAVDNASACS